MFTCLCAKYCFSRLSGTRGLSVKWSHLYSRLTLFFEPDPFEMSLKPDFDPRTCLSSSLCRFFRLFDAQQSSWFLWDRYRLTSCGVKWYPGKSWAQPAHFPEINAFCFRKRKIQNVLWTMRLWELHQHNFPPFQSDPTNPLGSTKTLTFHILNHVTCILGSWSDLVEYEYSLSVHELTAAESSSVGKEV